jgi:hypothetical protein
VVQFLQLRFVNGSIISLLVSELYSTVVYICIMVDTLKKLESVSSFVLFRPGLHNLKVHVGQNVNCSSASGPSFEFPA